MKNDNCPSSDLFKQFYCEFYDPRSQFQLASSFPYSALMWWSDYVRHQSFTSLDQLINFRSVYKKTSVYKYAPLDFPFYVFNYKVKTNRDDSFTFPKFYTNSNNYFIESENDVHTKYLFYASNEINDFYIAV